MNAREDVIFYGMRGVFYLAVESLVHIHVGTYRPIIYLVSPMICSTLSLCLLFIFRSTVFVIYCASKLHKFQWSYDAQ